MPSHYQHRVLFYGIMGALVFRAAFIALGAVLMRFHWIVLVFGMFLIFTGVNISLSPRSSRQSKIAEVSRRDPSGNPKKRKSPAAILPENEIGMTWRIRTWTIV